MKYTDTEECWRFIRSTRANPSGWAGQTPGRRQTYTSALEQAEQFFRLSDRAGYETKPVLLYYGLNQAARSIVAAAAKPDEPWEISGHGITTVGLDEQRGDDLGGLIVRDQRRKRNDHSSFLTLAEQVGSPTLPDGATIRELWSSLPEGEANLLAGSRYTLSVLSIRTGGSGRSTHVSVTGHLGALNQDEKLTFQERVQLFRLRYPDLRMLEPRRTSEGSRIQMLGIGGWGKYGLVVNANPPDVDALLNLRRVVPDLHRDDQPGVFLLPPTVGKNESPLDPIVNWWAILYALSMLARYKPAAWAAMLDVDSSQDATAIEYLMSQAHEVCVNLIVQHLKWFEVLADEG